MNPLLSQIIVFSSGPLATAVLFAIVGVFSRPTDDDGRPVDRFWLAISYWLTAIFFAWLPILWRVLLYGVPGALMRCGY